MRLLTFSFLKNCKLKRFCLGMPRMINGEAFHAELIRPRTKGDPSMVEISPSWSENLEPELRTAVLEDMQVFPDFVTEKEEEAMMRELEPQLKRMRYEFDHWDNAIHGFRETERRTWSDVSERVLERVRALAFAPSCGPVEPLPHAHVLDLAAAGYIKPHVDAVRFCGSVIAGVCLLSSAVMRLRHSREPRLVLDALLPRRGLYIMRGKARYDFTHEVLGGDASVWRGDVVSRARRVAVICRAAPRPEHIQEPPQIADKTPEDPINCRVDYV